MPRAASDSTVPLAPEAERYELLLAGEGESRQIPLKKEQELVIGRAEDGVWLLHTGVHLACTERLVQPPPRNKTGSDNHR